MRLDKFTVNDFIIVRTSFRNLNKGLKDINYCIVLGIRTSLII